jgi:hypothetical protein
VGEGGWKKKMVDRILPVRVQPATPQHTSQLGNPLRAAILQRANIRAKLPDLLLQSSEKTDDLFFGHGPDSSSVSVGVNVKEIFIRTTHTRTHTDFL